MVSSLQGCARRSHRDGSYTPKRRSPQDNGGKPERIRWRTIVARIIEKYRWTFDDVKKLTWFQITEIVYHKRDEHGRIVWDEKEIITPRERFGRRWREWGLSEEEIGYKWAEFLEIEGYKDSLERRGVKPDEVAQLAAKFERGLVAKRKWGR